MSKRAKVNLWKCILGIGVLAVLFVAGLAVTRAPLTSAKKGTLAVTKTVATSAKTALPNPGPLTMPTPDNINSVFELDGDIADVPPNAPDDWITVNCDGGNAFAKTGVLFDGLGTSIFTGGGSKDPDLLASWKHKNGSVPDKDEVLNAYAAKYNGANGDDILIFGADRYANDGTSFMGFWFFVNPVFAAPDGKFRQGPLNTDALAAHAIGDILVLAEYTNGGAVATAKVFEWVGTGGSESGGTLNDITATGDPGSVFSISNGAGQAIGGSCPAWVHTPKTGPNGTIQINAFFEGGINLDAFPALNNACFSSFMVETRSAASVTSTLKDFALGQFDTCPDIQLTKTANDTTVCDGSPTTYTYKVTNPTALSLSITLVDDNATPADLTDDLDVLADCAAYNENGVSNPSTEEIGPGEHTFMCELTLDPGEHTNIAKVVASIGGSNAEATATETVNVFEAPTAEAGTPQSVCKNAAFGTHDFTLAGSGTNGTPSWEILAGGTAGCSIFSGGGSYAPVVRCTGFGTATARLTVTSDAPSGTDCPNATDDVVLTINPNATAAAGNDDAVCVDDTFTHTDFNLSGSANNGTPSWTIEGANSANCSIFSGGDTLTPVVRCTALGTATARLTSTSSNGCANATDDLILTVNANPEANAGDDQIACSAGLTTPFTLAGSADHGSSTWTCVGGDCAKVSITTPGSLTSGVVFTGTGSATLKLLTTSNTTPGCGSAEDTVVLTVDPNPTVTICADEACSTDENLALTANVSPGTGTITYSWSGPAGGITSDPTLATITIALPGTYTVNVTRKATAESDACPGSQTFHVGLCGGAVCGP